MTMKSILAQTREELIAQLAELGQPAYRSKQIIEKIYKHFASEEGDFSNQPKAVREALPPYPAQICDRVSAPDGTEKLLLELNDGAQIEMVLIPSPNRMTFCLSTQVGCPVGCKFCASGKLGLERNLTAEEILAELLIGSKVHGSLPDNVVFMGIGEGLLNTKELFKALEFMTSPDYIGMSPRRIAVSTSGIVPAMRKFADLKREFILAVSLHAVSDEIRDRIIPAKCRYPIAEIMEAVDYYNEQSGRMVTFEYTLLAGINDSKGDAEKLASLARKHHAKINLIACNPTDGEFQRPSTKVVESFFETIERKYPNVTLRREKGSDELAACGQLRLRHRKD